MKKISILFSLVLLASSCVKQMEEPESAKIAGMWAVVDDNDFTTKYIEFEHGNIKEYVSGSEKHYVADKSVWNCQEGGFKQLGTFRYSLIDGTLNYGNNHLKMHVDGESMTLGDMKYYLVEKFCKEYYSTINVSNFTQSFAFNGGDKEWSYKITNPVEGFTLKVKAPDWISGLKVTADKISFTVAETTTTRTGIITLSYPSAEDLKILVTQCAAEINLDKASVTLGYAASSSSFTYSIPDSQDGYTLKVETNCDWITDVKDSGSSISFSVKENNSGSTRTGKITVTYAGVSKEFTVRQGGKESVNLSLSGTANCYVVSETGFYSFKSVKGNSSTSVGTVSSVAVLWESFGTSTTPSVGDLVESVSYEDGNIHFDTATTFKEGNAVIAAKDASGEILWSWHIWFTDQPKGQVYYNNAGTMMDRNLGVTYATPGNVGALGLLYQWGRKDPFLGSSSISRSTLAKSTISWPSTVESNSSTGTISYATAHPTTFITGSSNGDWYYTGSSSTDNTRWTTSDKSKSIYDPCPAGWRVPDGGSNDVWSRALGSSSDFTNSSLYNSTNEGMNFSGKFGSASTIWYPASGYRVYGGGSLSNVGSRGYYWSASPYGQYAYYLYFNYNGGVNPLDFSYRANGLSVRCLQESK